MIQRIADLRSNPNGFIDLKRCPFLNNLIEILAFYILHYNIMDIFFLAHIIDADYVRVR
ncbi:hypothetical protein D3C85_1779670 [compost metagenome]